MTTEHRATQQSISAMPSAIKDAEATKDILHTLRHFHLGNPAVKQQLQPMQSDYLPALLDAYRDTSRLRYDYPLFLYPPGRNDGEELVKPLGKFLTELADKVAPGDTAGRMLKDNLLRLEQILRSVLQDTNAPVAARSLLLEQGRRMLQQLALDEDSNEKLAADVQQLVQAVPAESHFLAYGKHPAIHLLIHVIRNEVIPRHATFRKQLAECIRGLKSLLEVEREKSAESYQPEALKESVGLSSSMFDTTALSRVMHHSQGSMGMSSERKQRVERALQLMQAYDPEAVLVRFVHQAGLDQRIFDDISGFEAVIADQPCTTAKRLFDQEATRLADVFAAVRISKLELEDLYDPAIHDPWFACFNWEAFSQDELLLVPAVIVLENALRAAGEAMPAFSDLLNSGRPIQILVRVLGHANPGRSTDADTFTHFRTELGYLAIAHRQAVVCQSSAARHDHLLRQFTTALQSTRTGLHLINVGLRPTGQDLGLNGWLVAGAALEGRVHPFFQMNPAAGDSLADRMNFSGNPQADRDWPVHEFRYLDENAAQVNESLAFTFADYALLIPRLHEYFTPIPLICEGDSLLPVADYLQLDEEQAARHVPFIWAVNKNSELRQLAVSRVLTHACRDRLNFWHSLQEMAGVRSRYLELGIAAAREEITTEAVTEKQQLLQVHAEEIERVRTESAAEVMGRLTDVLMGMDFCTGAPRMADRPSASAAPLVNDQSGEAIVQPEPAVEEEDKATAEDPWIDTPLCTSCNDCLAINPQLFTYDDGNQAYISDASLGSYAQLVEAAEICPSNCIHPGKPTDASESGLEELMQRAAAYN